MHKVYLYTLPDCHSCEKARKLLRDKQYEVEEYSINNPILEIGVKILFKDNTLYAPIVVIPEDGIYILGGDDGLLRIVNLKSEAK